ncbi:IPTL-CTERM sorting domain-containing protein [Brevundimonas sp.]|uniref:IPTL-CTERM sorting domain-containing protein n=1 Tax=Brevundimonas sp. TaxID=1871086 RepID=UPI002638527C|nr:IPTL-CTERM sorting domain-containing protein [Brevundimonas sp.]
MPGIVRAALAVILVVMAGLVPSSSWAQVGGRVAVLGAPSLTAWNAEVVSKILADGRFIAVDNIDVGTSTPSLATLQTYRAVIVYNDASVLSRATLGDNLHAYLLAGGGVVNAEFDTSTAHLAGAWATNTDTAIAGGGPTVGEATLGTIALLAHPTVAGVTTFNGGFDSYRSSGAITPGSTLVASWSTGEPLVAFKQVGAGTVVSLNFFPPSSDSRSGFWTASTDGAKLMANALVFAGDGAAPPAPVPTLSEWAMILFGLILAGGAALYIQRRQSIA